MFSGDHYSIRTIDIKLNEENIEFTAEFADSNVVKILTIPKIYFIDMINEMEL